MSFWKTFDWFLFGLQFIEAGIDDKNYPEHTIMKKALTP